MLSWYLPGGSEGRKSNKYLMHYTMNDIDIAVQCVAFLGGPIFKSQNEDLLS
jgi:hypothetical protein